MKLLLDTHVFIWWVQSADQLSPRVLHALSEPTNEFWLSVASMWEIQLKVQLRRLDLAMPLVDLVTHQFENIGLQVLTIQPSHVFALDQFPLIHRDPFDRILLGQSTAEQLTLVTADSLITQYGVSTLW